MLIFKIKKTDPKFIVCKNTVRMRLRKVIWTPKKNADINQIIMWVQKSFHTNRKFPSNMFSMSLQGFSDPLNN